MSKENKTFRLEKKLIQTLESQAKKQARSTSNVVHGYLEDRVTLGNLWPAFEPETLKQIEEWLGIPADEREEFLTKKRRK